ncbi:hypothetical protein CALCODRAFT_242500 [Calocera cornea HHB12733]|uniref:Uncharacterized protein n=1 Tax=Calocera cornea HHB12733 TaxID=1353952 RepID=A0A165GPN3_9BASI|nr:hypothetical protein CALCODRAFT_242500 [Calocera cornea HHB12733]
MEGRGLAEEFVVVRSVVWSLLVVTTVGIGAGRGCCVGAALGHWDAEPLALGNTPARAWHRTCRASWVHCMRGGVHALLFSCSFIIHFLSIIPDLISSRLFSSPSLSSTCIFIIPGFCSKPSGCQSIQRGSGSCPSLRRGTHSAPGATNGGSLSSWNAAAKRKSTRTALQGAAPTYEAVSKIVYCAIRSSHCGICVR